MELTSFGSIMKFAIERESDVKAILSEAAKSEKLNPIREKIEALISQNSGNLKLLERTRREGICEMVLHPISGLDEANYLFSATKVEGMSPNDFETLIKKVCGKIAKFYADAADKLPADDAKRAFHKLAGRSYV